MEKIKNTSPDFKNNTKNIKSGLRTKSAFTLVELIVVITILAILGTIAFISLQGYSRDARDATRTADLGNIKTSLELFSLKTGKYPSPDSYSTITYSGGTENVWFQGNVGDIVTTNLKSLNEKPLDPLTNTPYTYSVTNSYKEYEVLALYEGSVAYNPIINQTNAAVSSLTPKIVGNYNGVFVKTTNYIIPTPSIVTAEPLTGGILILNSTNINSQVITNGINIPKNSLTQTSTGKLAINLSVYTGSITKNSGTGAMITAVQQIQGAYTGTILATQNNIVYILNQTTNDELIALGNITILKGGSPLVYGISTIQGPHIKTSLDCTTLGQVIYGTLDGTNIGLTCNDDIIVCDGTGSGYTLSACNVGASIAGTGSNSYGNLFQWGNNAGIPTLTVVLLNGLINTTGYGPLNYYSSTSFRKGGSYPNDWSSSDNKDLWGDITKTNEARKGPCTIGYHIPTNNEWQGINSAGNLYWGISGKIFSNALFLPFGGAIDELNGSIFGQATNGFYWSSSTAGKQSYNINFTLGSKSIGGTLGRASIVNVRCIKN